LRRKESDLIELSLKYLSQKLICFESDYEEVPGPTCY